LGRRRSAFTRTIHCSLSCGNLISGNTVATRLICRRRQRFSSRGHLTFRSTGLPAVEQTLPQPQEPPDAATSPMACRVVDRISDPKCIRQSNCRKRRTMFLGLGFVLLLLWLGGFFVFHISAFFIHILLILAVVSIICGLTLSAGDPDRDPSRRTRLAQTARTFST